MGNYHHVCMPGSRSGAGERALKRGQLSARNEQMLIQVRLANPKESVPPPQSDKFFSQVCFTFIKSELKSFGDWSIADLREVFRDDLSRDYLNEESEFLSIG